MSAAGFVQRWHHKANESQDCFDHFFSAWIALVIKARGHLSEQQLEEPDRDRIAIIHYFDEQAVVAVLGKMPEQVAWLAVRNGTGTVSRSSMFSLTHPGTSVRSLTSWHWFGPVKPRVSRGVLRLRPQR